MEKKTMILFLIFSPPRDKVLIYPNTSHSMFTRFSA